MRTFTIIEELPQNIGRDAFTYSINPDLLIGKNAEFFVALAKRGVHTFVMLGVMDEKNKPHVLTVIGKKIEEGNSCPSLIQVLLGAKALFSGDREGGKELQGFSHSVSYAAYAISYEQYLQSLDLMNEMSPEKNHSFYQPLETVEKGGETRRFRYQPLKHKEKEKEEKRKKIIDKSHHLSPLNTCRHTGAEVVEYIKDSPLPSDISRVFFRALPLKATFEKGTTTPLKDKNGAVVSNNYFYVFPPPPTLFSDCQARKEKMAILITIYKRMEELIQKDPHGQNTRDKFDALKELYISQTELFEKKKSFSDVLTSVAQWTVENKAVISELRAQGFFGGIFTKKSSTLKMAEQLEKRLIRLSRK